MRRSRAVAPLAAASPRQRLDVPEPAAVSVRIAPAEFNHVGLAHFAREPRDAKPTDRLASAAHGRHDGLARTHKNSVKIFYNCLLSFR